MQKYLVFKVRSFIHINHVHLFILVMFIHSFIHSFIHILGFAKDLLEVSDVLDKAVSMDNQSVEDLHQGLKMTQVQLNQVFRRHGLEVRLVSSSCSTRILESSSQKLGSKSGLDTTLLLRL